ncbi:GTP cyclohydrolase I FolE2 [Pseudoalteromonas sp. MMG010]|uniref:GTP cyclohydrolase FolE2 n=1 Tax=Pseudoalteromonas sp. MMG010 TaxID=2822685 RepID=UPI001B3A3FA9|nr:GTP cyclohydrolase FolE2 [Pseudoalteromonas sp. MMG010]MBQ4833612.1 GTP cyclohydrolase I FolE2 [Pseudoalteromonas sp. MMG010]
MNAKSHLPDITSQYNSLNALPLQWVGMEAISLPLHILTIDGEPIHTHAKADIFVSLNKADAKGIHMSRLYLLLKQHLAEQPLMGDSLTVLLNNMLSSQQGLSLSAKVNLAFELTLNKPALLSNQAGYQAYPVKVSKYIVDGEMVTDLSLTIAYSSTCPCSAALARQALSDAVDKQFAEQQVDKNALLAWLSSAQGSIATPHSQRSYAYITMSIKGEELPDLPSLINELESAIGTPVQTAVKREDEQAFAKLNAENLLFCEDAARRIKRALELKANISNYTFKVEHQESLHAHNAVVYDQKFPSQHGV